VDIFIIHNYVDWELSGLKMEIITLGILKITFSKEEEC
jgi:hypothetical protein